MKKKLTFLMFSLLLTVGWTSLVFAQSSYDEAYRPFTANEAKAWTYSWTDANGTTHNNVDPTLKVTDAWQMYYLLRHVYMDKRFPGPFQSAYTKNNVRERDVYYGAMEGGWDIPGTKIGGTSTYTLQVPNYSSNIVITTTSGYVGILSIKVIANGVVLDQWTTSESTPALPSNWEPSKTVSYNTSDDYSIYLSQGGTITIPASVIQGKNSVAVVINARLDSSDSSGNITVNGTSPANTLSADDTYNQWAITPSSYTSQTVTGDEAIGDITIWGVNNNAAISKITVTSGSTTLFSWDYATNGMGSSSSTGYWPMGMNLNSWSYNSTNGNINFGSNLNPITIFGWLFTGYNSVTVSITAYNRVSAQNASLIVNNVSNDITTPYSSQGTTPTTKTWTVSKRAFNSPTRYQADTYKPNKEGYTVFVVKLKNTITKEPDHPDFTDESFFDTPQQIHDYLAANVESIQLLTDGLVIGEDDQIGTVFNAPVDEYNKFFFLSKGQARQKADIVNEMEVYNQHVLGEQVPFRQMFEQFSPTGGKSGDQIFDFYSEMMQGKVYRIVHDCLSVIQNEHEFSMAGNNDTTRYEMSGMNFFIPDYRLKYWETTDSLKRGGHLVGVYTVDGRTMNPVLRVSPDGDPTYDRTYAIGNTRGTASDKVVWYAQYDTAHHAPVVGLYLIDLKAEATKCEGYSEDNRFYQSTLDWTSSLNEMSGNGVSQTYIIYEVRTDSVTGEKYNYPIDTLENCTDFHPQLTLDTLYEQHAHSYTVTYVIMGSPTDSDHPGFVAWSNRATVIIPGYDDFMILNLHHYESDFNVNYTVPQGANYYRNYLQPENDFVNGITRESILGGYDSFILYRTSTDGKVPVAKLKFAVDSQNKVRYKITYFEENQDTDWRNNIDIDAVIQQLINKSNN